MNQLVHPIPHDAAATVHVPIRVAGNGCVGAELKPGQDRLGGLRHGRARADDVDVDPIGRGADQHGIMDGAQTSIPRSIARQQATRSISAPLACMGKLRSERGLGLSPIRTCQPNTV